jgi:hypothetical protein
MVVVVVTARNNKSKKLSSDLFTVEYNWWTAPRSFRSCHTSSVGWRTTTTVNYAARLKGEEGRPNCAQCSRLVSLRTRDKADDIGPLPERPFLLLLLMVVVVVAIDEVAVPCVGAFEGTAKICKRSKGRIWNNKNYV